MMIASLSVAAFHNGSAPHDPDPISGEWNVLFEVQDTKVPGTFNLNLDGDKVTGKVETKHTGPGTISHGSWVDNKLSFTADFAAHESIAITGKLKDGSLIGEFSTEGTKGTWEAKRK
jgi:hypothetical protein